MLKPVLLASATSLVVFASAAVAQTVPATGSQQRVWSAGAEKVGALTSRAWAARGTGVTIAIVDSGIRADHNEFTGALVGGL
jgi:subtilisin family serine protease